MNGIGWITVAEAARLCGTDELRITLWMNGNHIAYARFDGILMIDGASLAALFSRNRVATIYEDVAQQRGKPGRPGRLRRLLDTPLDTFGLSQRIVRACRELGVFTVEHLLVHLRRFRFSRLVLCPQLRQRIGSRDPPAAPAGRLDRRRQPTGFQGLVPVIPAIFTIFASRLYKKADLSFP
ncbi:hypothetical protein NXU98_03205 [Parabacteroides distasonis]|nr:hypothetical protein NXU98_03205 [Parabacteroides distasonis]